MTPEEIDTALSELSNRMERVRALYEQYFMGIERLEPMIARKDLDRRLEVLRKTPFQNTAKRFKFQTLIQRYTALQQYWYRTCRDIENGTYRKHVKKAQRRFENEEFPRSSEDQTDLAQEGVTRTKSVKEQTEADMAALLDSNIDLTAELGQMFTALNEPTPAVKAGTGLLGQLNKAVPAGEKPKSPLTSGTAVKPLAPIQPRSPVPALSPIQPLSSAQPQSPIQPLSSAQPQSPVQALSPLPRLQPLPRVTSTAPRPLATTTPEKPTDRSAAQPSPNQAPAPIKAQTPPDRPQTPPDRPQTPPNRPQTAAQPPASPLRSPAPAAASTQASGLSEDRIRAIHAQYQSARAETKATAVSYEKLEKNLRETEAQLRATHKGKNVDFDVAIKDGKAILKPRLK